MTDRLPPWAGLKRCRWKAGNVLARTLRSTLTLSQDVDLNGDGDVDPTLDLVRGPSAGLRILVEESRPRVQVEVDDGLNVHGHVNLNDGRQGQGPSQRQPDDAPEVSPSSSARRLMSDGFLAGPSPLVRHLSSDRFLAGAASGAGGRA